DPAAWPGEGRGFSIASWATETRVLVADGRLVGVVAVRADAAPDGAMPARVALAADAREASLTRLLVDGVVGIVGAAGGSLARLFVSTRAEWLLPVLRGAGFERVRTVAHMLLPASAPTPEVRP